MTGARSLRMTGPTRGKDVYPQTTMTSIALLTSVRPQRSFPRSRSCQSNVLRQARRAHTDAACQA